MQFNLQETSVILLRKMLSPQKSACTVYLNINRFLAPTQIQHSVQVCFN